MNGIKETTLFIIRKHDYKLLIGPGGDISFRTIHQINMANSMILWEDQGSFALIQHEKVQNLAEHLEDINNWKYVKPDVETLKIFKHDAIDVPPHVGRALMGEQYDQQGSTSDEKGTE
jgi:hypothetical protein